MHLLTKFDSSPAMGIVLACGDLCYKTLNPRSLASGKGLGQLRSSQVFF
jgi:hypothetical protein